MKVPAALLRSKHSPALLRHEVVSRAMLLLVQRVYVVHWAGHQDDQKEGNGTYYATAHLHKDSDACTAITPMAGGSQQRMGSHRKFA